MIIVVILLAFVVGTISGGAASIYTPYLIEEGFLSPWMLPRGDAIRIVEREKAVASSDEDRITDIVEEALQSVVSINITKDVSSNDLQFDGLLEEYYDDPFFSFPVPEQLPDQEETFERMRIGGGTGFFVTEDGIIATNKHVIDDEEAEYIVVTQDGNELKATLLAKDPALDLAFLKVEGEGYPALRFGNSDDIEIGETVIAIGNVLAEFSNSVTKGIVSGKNRRLLAGSFSRSEIIEEAIQTDAAINFGNSGGPLINLSGEVVGMNTAISDQAQLLGFALPSNSIVRALESVREHGRVIRAWLGVRFVPVDSEYADRNNLSYDYGALIIFGDGDSEAVIPGSPADSAGLEPGDVILSIDGILIDREQSLANIISKKFPGEKVMITFARGEDERVVEATLEERDSNF